MQLTSSVTVAVAVAVAYAYGYNSDATPSLGTSICHRCGLKKTNKQTKKTKKKEKKINVHGNSSLRHTYKIWRQVMFIKLKSRLKKIRNKTGNQYFLSQFIVSHSSLATGHLNGPFIHICYNTDSFCYWFIQYWMLREKKEFILTTKFSKITVTE